jgi:hypothetical protein
LQGGGNLEGHIQGELLESYIACVNQLRLDLIGEITRGV